MSNYAKRLVDEIAQLLF